MASPGRRIRWNPVTVQAFSKACSFSGALCGSIVPLACCCDTNILFYFMVSAPSLLRSVSRLEVMDGGDMVSQLALCDEPSLRKLCSRLCSVEALHVAKDSVAVGGVAIACVTAMLQELEQCGDGIYE
jgi:hypothetical protein